MSDHDDRRFRQTALWRSHDATGWSLRQTAVRLACSITLLITTACAANLSADEDLSRYFTQLRQRGLFVVAEHYATTQLRDPRLPARRRTDLVVELSRTLVEHAWYASPNQQTDIWQQARQVVLDELQQQPSRPELLTTQAAFVQAARVRHLYWEAKVHPEDRRLRTTFQEVAADTVSQLTERNTALENLLKPPHRSSEWSPLAIRQLLAALHCELGDVYRYRAALTDSQSPERASDLVDAEQAYRQARVGNHDPRIHGRSLVGRAECRRLQGDFAAARELCDAGQREATSLPYDLRDSLDATRVRCWLDESLPLLAAQHLLDLRQARHRMSGELWFVQLETLLHLRNLAQEKQDEALVASLNGEAQLALSRVAEQAGGAWTRFCRLLWERDQGQQNYGPELDRLIRTAKAEYLSGHHQESAAAYQSAITAAQEAELAELTRELQYTRGSILLEARKYDAAAEQFRQLAAAKPQHDRTAGAHLLSAFALGRLYDEQRTQTRRENYTQALEQHLREFSQDATAHDARFMLAQLQEQRLQFSRALPLYLAIARDHARYHAATLGAARCGERLLQRLQELQEPTQAFFQQVVTELTQRLQGWPEEPPRWSAEQAEIAIRMARLHLQGRPVNHAAALALLQQFEQAQQAPRDNRDQVEVWKSLRDLALPLQLVALAGTGRSLDAQQLLKSNRLSDPGAALAVVLGLEELAQGPATTQFVDLTELLVEAVHRTEPLRNKLAAADQQQFDLARVRAYLITGRTAEGMAVVDTLSEQFARDPARLRSVALLVSADDTHAAQTSARDLWRRLEQLETAGTPAWLTARAGVIDALLHLKETAEAGKLLKLTRAIYPDLPDEALRQRFETLTRRLQSPANR